MLKEEKEPCKANDMLLRALQKMPKVGHIRTAPTLGLGSAIRPPGSSSRRQRPPHRASPPIGLLASVESASNRPRTMDYPFTIVEMRLGKDDGERGECSRARGIPHRRRPTACSRTVGQNSP